MDLDRAMIATKPNGLRYVVQSKPFATCEKCGQHCEIIVRPAMPDGMRYLSDCCSAHIKIG